MTPDQPVPEQLAPPAAEVKALIALYNVQRFAELEAQARQSIEQYPNAAMLWKLLGASLQMQGKDAMPAFQKVVELTPGDAEAHNNLGSIYQERGQLDDALASYRHALRIDPRFIEAHYNLGNALTDQGRLEDALASYRAALKLKPDFALALSNMGAALQELGRVDEAIASSRRALQVDPGMPILHSNLLGMLNSTAVLDPQSLLQEARRYGKLAGSKVTARYHSWLCTERPQRLRVGIVSADLHNHPVGYFLEGLIEHLDPARIEMFAYQVIPHEDELTLRIKKYFAGWKTLDGLDDEAAARLIHDDGVHMLLDLSGHTEQNRLPVFAWKPAPVQVSWLGYWATTGVAEIDYLIADETGVPPSGRNNFTETIWYLPDTRMCFTPPATSLPVSPLPALHKGHVTFGSFQRLDKLGKDLMPAWSKILSAIPDARLRLARRELSDPAVAAQFVERLKLSGTDRSRVDLHGSLLREAYLASYAEIDMVLDTFPYAGGTTTCEALWMGVPTITLAGETLLARQGASLLTAAGLEQWVAASEEEYVAKAIAFASDLPKLAALRAGLREQVRTSPLFDAPRFAKNFEDALWGMWQARAQDKLSATAKLADRP
ncbi:MAG TPA: tetratricopeptide repeat protein [Gallionella sp.]|nr:tetratricopeptide repeat protein [Gallionella sp.]